MTCSEIHASPASALARDDRNQRCHQRHTSALLPFPVGKTLERLEVLLILHFTILSHSSSSNPHPPPLNQCIQRFHRAARTEFIPVTTLTSEQTLDANLISAELYSKCLRAWCHVYSLLIWCLWEFFLHKRVLAESILWSQEGQDSPHTHAGGYN